MSCSQVLNMHVLCGQSYMDSAHVRFGALHNVLNNGNTCDVSPIQLISLLESDMLVCVAISGVYLCTFDENEAGKPCFLYLNLNTLAPAHTHTHTHTCTHTHIHTHIHTHTHT